MTAPFVKEFDISGTKFTSVVIDPEEFDAFCDELVGLFDVNHSERTGDEMIDKIKRSGNLPLMARGTKTEKFFKRWGVKTDKLGVVRRGIAKEWGLNP